MLKKIGLLKRFYLCKQNSDNAVYFDICNVCNARCLYCQTGFANRNKIPCNKGKKFVEINHFQKILKHLKIKKFLEKNTLLSLYNWGEPMLHPEFAKIIEIATQEDCIIGLSTNANKLPDIPKNLDCSHIAHVIFSMCGFSQESYNKIHMFDFEHIKSNIKKIVEIFRKNGCFGRFSIAFHIYQFNFHEIQAAKEFAKSLGIRIRPYYATINDWDKINLYLKSKLPEDYLINTSKDLFMGLNLQHLIPSTTCPQFKNVTIDANGNCILCCANDTSLGNILELSPEDVFKVRINSKICTECLSSGLSNMIHSPINLNLMPVKKR